MRIKEQDLTAESRRKIKLIPPGTRFHMLVVESLAYLDDRRGTSWHCRCDCGGTTTTYRTALVSGNTRSCGCLRGRNIDRVNERRTARA